MTRDGQTSHEKQLILSPQTSRKCSEVQFFVDTNKAGNVSKPPLKIFGVDRNKHGWKCPKVSLKTLVLLSQTQLETARIHMKNSWFWSPQTQLNCPEVNSGTFKPWSLQKRMEMSKICLKSLVLDSTNTAGNVCGLLVNS